MHWVTSTKKDACTDTLEKRLGAAADQFRSNSGLKTQESSAPVRASSSCVLIPPPE
jgi:type I restriction enzyme M protein